MSESEGQPPLLRGGRLSVALDAIRFAVSRSSGPGGQNVNKQNTRIELRVALSAIQGLTPPLLQKLLSLAGKRVVGGEELRLVSQETRSQEQNRAIAMEQLVNLLTAASHIPRTRYATRPTRASRRRRVEAKKRRGETKAQRKGPGQE